MMLAHFSSHLVLLLVLALLLGGCAGSASVTAPPPAASQPTAPPSWIQRPPQRAGYVYGVASADIHGTPAHAIERARQQAQLDLLARIQVHIGGETHTHTRARLHQGELQDLHETLLQQAASQVAPVTLAGLEVVETWVDSVGRSAWALAQLDRRRAEQQLLDQLAALDQRLLARPLPTQGDRLTQVRAVLPHLADWQERRQLIEQLQFLEALIAVDPQRQQRIEAHEAATRALIRSLGFRLESSQDHAQQMQPLIAAQLTALGFQLRSQQPDLILRLDLSMQPVTRQGLHHRLAQAQGQVVTPQGEVLYALHEVGRATSSDPHVATQRAIETMAQALAQALAQGLYTSL